MARRMLVSRLRALSLSALPSRSFTSRAVPIPGASPLLRLRPLLAAADCLTRPGLAESGLRCFSSQPTNSSLNDPSPNWSNRPPKETILLDGCDFEHWLVVVETPDPSLTRDEIIDSYIKTLAQVLGSEEEAKMSIYSVSTKHYFAFGCKVSEEISYKIKPLPKVRWVLPDSYLDVKNKDYGGEPFIDGKAAPYDPKYHEEWVRNNARAQERSRRSDRPRNFDRSRNFERRRENMQNFQNREAPPMQNQQFQNPNPMNSTPPNAPNPLSPTNGPPPAQNQQFQNPNAHNATPPNAPNPMPPRNGPPMHNSLPNAPNHPSQMPNTQSGYIPNAGPNYQGSGQGYQRGAPGYQGGGQGYQGGNSGSNMQGGPGYQGGNPTGYQGGNHSYQGNNPSGSQSSTPVGGAAYQGGTPSGYQGGNPPYQGGFSSYQPPNSSYQGGQNYQQGGGNYQGGAPAYQGRDMPGRD
ncbi:multiple organellar RNA editing factor 8, chloroplastic/mitochondrial-like isoform X2 [Canna indica]|uniref:Multiple organellar RNA editing factor 8, chloroplastic/mitochondrial-like isoform X2 n=1 Tax=Canna indica TaxID=4628 RepID=A0AAQ3K4K1_9LILI|nr:multiple organellar RNA editing factor 8, chloroplastic/mitochondrial-like isoform X2 [Canna indica]